MVNTFYFTYRNTLINFMVTLFIRIFVDKIFDERNIYVLLFNSRHVIPIPSFRIVNLLCCGSYFSNTTFIDGKAKYIISFGTSSGHNFGECVVYIPT